MASYESNGIPPKITLYTNHLCPYAQRAHIALKELDLPYEEVIIDLDRPREQWYLDLNPRGLVPIIKYSDGVLENEIITESAIVAHFLADARPSHLLPASGASPTAALFRARVAFFLDTWSAKVAPFVWKTLQAQGAEQDAVCQAWLAALANEVEPLLAGAEPFFAGRDRLTLVEVNAAPFLLRMYALAEAGLVPRSFKDGLHALPRFSRWAERTMAESSVTQVWDEKDVVERTRGRIEKTRQAAK
ncbi:hypothetical protein LTR04_003359 [Oleoguttula sp. CCFEE 6159]|nr:hypothetical protein LTR04_003359 [Oleoguttula sp. CCFEE 6159]